jgi:hypothetical protein
MHSTIKFFCITLFTAQVLWQNTASSFDYMKLIKPIAPLISFNVSDQQCQSIDFVFDNEINIKIDKRLCQNIDTPSECFDSIIDIPEKKQLAILLYSYKKIQSIISDLPSSKNFNKLSCYSRSLIEFLNTKEFNDLDNNVLFDHYLPILFGRAQKNDLVELTKIWSPYILEKMVDQNFFLKPNKNLDQDFYFFLMSNFLQEAYFEGLDSIEKYQLSLDILNNSLHVNKTVPSSIKHKIIHYLESRDLGWDFPREIISKFNGDQDFAKLFEKIFLIAQYESNDPFLGYYSHSFNSLISSNKTPYAIRCSLYTNFSTLIAQKKSNLGNEINKVIKDLLKVNLPCATQAKKTLKAYDTSSLDFVARWCPSHRNCSLHFYNDEWQEKYGYCKKDTDCKGLKYDGCERIYFNDQFTRTEIELYHKYCQNMDKTEKTSIEPHRHEAVCLDNLCQGKRY